MSSSGFSGQEDEIGVPALLDRADLPARLAPDGTCRIAGGGEQRSSG